MREKWQRIIMEASTIKNTRERDVEGYLTRRLAGIGLACKKFIPDQDNGMPDRVVLLPDQRVLWVELKTIGGELSELQKLRHVELQRAGHAVEVVWTKAQADRLVERLAADLRVS